MPDHGYGLGSDQGIGSWPRRCARKASDRVVFEHRDGTWSYRDLDRRTTRLAHALRGSGVKRDDRVAYLGPNHPAFLETLFATCALGAVFVPLNTRLAATEIGYMLRDSGTSVLIYAPECAGTATAACEELVPGTVRTLTLAEQYETAIGQALEERLDESVSLDNPCMIMYTSGTSGRPKGVVLTHGNITWNSLNVLADSDFTSAEVTLVTAPMFHTAALNMTCLPTLLKGGELVIECDFAPDRVLDLIERHGITCLFGVPAMFAALARSPRWDRADLSSVTKLLCGGAPVPETLIHTYLKRGFSFIQGYGMTEAAPGTLLLDQRMSTVKAGSAGVPHFFTDVRLALPDAATDAAPGERGEILVRGPNVMPGYHERPHETEQTLLPGGWLRSGDVGVLDEDGYAYIVDRVKDMIISGGENIYPAEVENVLYEHPDVAECAVIGVPDPVWGEVGKAVVVLKPGAVPDTTTGQALLEHATARLARYKVPKTVRFTATLPRTASGKIVKSRLRSQGLV
jgi:fatty-acyl-CoA synthase